MMRCDGCCLTVTTALNYGELKLCEACIRRECMQEQSPVNRRPWLASDSTDSTPTISKDDFAA